MIPMADIEKMGGAIAQSGLFGMKTAAQAIALMLIAQAEGKHPAIAARDYHIIQGKPSLKADAMLSRFQEYGGKFKWLHYDEKCCEAWFSHSSTGELTIKWTVEMAANVKSFDKESNKWQALTEKQTWKNYPRQMLSARVISEGVRKLCPAACNGMYTPEEVQDFEPLPPKPVETTAVIIEQEKPQQQIEAPKAAASKKDLPCDYISGIIEDVQIKEGERSGKSWKRFGIKVNGESYGTFDTNIGESAQTIIGEQAKIGWITEGKFKTCVSIEPIIDQPQSDQPQNGNLPF